MSENTQMAHALTTALANQPKDSALRIPSKRERVWTWLRDHPNSTVAETAAALKLGAKNASQSFFQMHGAGTLVRQRGSRFGSGVWEYRAVGTEYSTPRAKRKANAGYAPAVSTEVPVVRSVPVKFDIEQYTLGELREIHRQLNALFNK